MRRKVTRKLKQFPITISEILKDPTIGEGKSKSIYVPPIKDDVAVIISFFNPSNYRRPLKNLIYVMHTLKEQDIPCYVIECVFPRRKPQVPDADIVVHSETPMFYKEQLFNIMEKKVPEKYTKLVFMDGDIIFEAPDWVDKVSEALNNHEIIMPFEDACWLYPDNIAVRSKKKSLAWAIANKVEFKMFNAYHPGFAWAMRRDFFREIGGFFDKKFLGGGDVAMAATVVPGVTQKALSNIYGQRAVADSYLEYYKRVRAQDPKLGYLKFDAYHLFHGLTSGRRYSSRYNKIQHILKRGFESFTKLNEDGLYEFTDPELIEYAKNYFANRNEDISLTDAMKPSFSSTTPSRKDDQDPNQN